MRMCVCVDRQLLKMEEARLYFSLFSDGSKNYSTTPTGTTAPVQNHSTGNLLATYRYYENCLASLHWDWDAKEQGGRLILQVDSRILHFIPKYGNVFVAFRFKFSLS